MIDFDPETMTDAQRKAFIRAVMGPPRRVLIDTEREHILMLMALIEPYRATNNQHSWTEYYRLNDREYHVTTFAADDIVVEEMLDEDGEAK